LEKLCERISQASGNKREENKQNKREKYLAETKALAH
jgi:hypothetical protein